MKKIRVRTITRGMGLGCAAVFLFAAVTLFIAGTRPVYAEVVSYNSPLIWRADGAGDYRLPDYKAGKTYELKGYVKTVGQIESITLNCEFTGEVTLEASANAGTTYTGAVCGVPVTGGFGAGNKLKWRITLGEDTEVTQVYVSYTDDSGVKGPLGTPELSGFSRRRAIYVSNAGAQVFNYQVRVFIGYSSGAAGADTDCGGSVRRDFRDVRFTAADKLTILPYYLESVTESDNPVAAFLVKVPQIPAGSLPIYMYYGNSAAEDKSCAAGVFDLYDDFTDDELDTDKWEKEVSDQGSCTLSSSRLKLENAKVMAADYLVTDGIVEYRAAAGNNGEVWMIVRGKPGGSLWEDTNQVAYSSKYAGAEHCIAVGEIVKVNEEKAITVATVYDYRVILDDTSLTFQRLAADTQTLQAEVSYNDTGGLTSGRVGFKAGGGGVSSFDWIRARKYSSSIEVNKTACAAAQAETVAMPAFSGLDIDKKGDLVLAEDEEDGGYVSVVIPLPYQTRIFMPEWEGENIAGQVQVDAAMDGAAYVLDCDNGKFYYASKGDFTGGDKLKFKAALASTEEEEQDRPQVKRIAFDYRPGKITLVSPNGGEVLRPGKKAVITWSAWDYESSYLMRIDYSADAGQTYQPVSTVVLNSGTYSWVVPDRISDKVKIKVSDKAAPDTVYDVSDKVFSISASAAEEEAAAEEEEAGAEEEVIPPQERVRSRLKSFTEGRRRAGTQVYDVVIKLRDNRSSDPEEDARACYKDGDIIMARPVGHEWSETEKNSFLIIQLYLTEEEARDLIQAKEAFTGEVDEKGDFIRKVVGRRKHKVDLEEQFGLAQEGVRDPRDVELLRRRLQGRKLDKETYVEEK